MDQQVNIVDRFPVFLKGSKVDRALKTIDDVLESSRRSKSDRGPALGKVQSEGRTGAAALAFSGRWLVSLFSLSISLNFRSLAALPPHHSIS